MSTVVEVSEGIEPQRRVFEPPVSNADREQPRYVTFLGNLVEPRTMQEREWTKGGGIEVTNPCLRFVQNFVRKGRITPVLKDAHDWMPADWVKKIVDGDPLQSGWFAQSVPTGFQVPFLPPARGMGNGITPSPTGNYYSRMAYPADQINWITTGPVNFYEGFPRGLVELTSLKGENYRPQSFSDGTFVDPEIRKIQLAIFPDYPRLPTLLSDILQLLDDAEVHTSLLPVLADYQLSLQQFTDFANTSVQNAEDKMREAAGSVKGYVPRYTPMDLVLLEQLGRTRRDREIVKEATTSGDTELRDILKQFMLSQITEKQVAPTVVGLNEPTPEKEVKMWVCEHCNEEMKLTAKSFHLNKHCRVLHPKVEELKTDEPAEG